MDKEMISCLWTDGLTVQQIADPTGRHFVTVCHPAFLAWRHLVYRPDGSKRHDVLIERLTPLGLAVWYMDDGTYSGRDGTGTFTTQVRHDEAITASSVFRD